MPVIGSMVPLTPMKSLLTAKFYPGKIPICH